MPSELLSWLLTLFTIIVVLATVSLAAALRRQGRATDSTRAELDRLRGKLERLESAAAAVRPEQAEGESIPALASRREGAASASIRPRPETTAKAPPPSAPPAPTLIRVPNLARTERAATESSAEPGERHRAIWALADAGLSAETIAQRTGQPAGQVELILGLRRSSATANRVDGEPHS